MATYDLGKVVGDDGATGNGVASVTLISTSGKVKTYRMTFTDGTYVDYQVTDGSDASVTIVTSWNSTTSNSKVPSEKLTKSSLDNKIDKSQTAGLVKNDGTIDTNTYLTSSSASSTYQPLLVSGTNIKTVNNNSLLGSGNINIESGSNVDIVTAWEQTLSDVKVPSEKLTKDSLDNKVDKVTGKGLSTNDFTNNYKSAIDGLSTVASSGSYTDLSNKPSIPTKTSDLTNDSNYISTSSTSGLIKNDGTIDTTSYSTFSGSYNDLSNKPTIPSASTTTPSADTSSGSYGSGTSYARSNHTHPKSSLYAEATHSHTKSQITDFPSIPSKTSDLTNDGADGTNVFVANNDSRLSDARTPTSHTHGNLTNDGKVGSTANYFVYTTTSGTITSKQKIGNITTGGAIGSTSGLPIKTGTSGVLEAGSFGTTSGTFAEGNHTHSAYVNPTKVTSWSSTPSNDNVASEKLIKDSLDGKLDNAISSTAVSIASNDDILITDYSDSNKVKRVANILSSQMKDPNGYVWIGSSADATQETINSLIDSGFSDVFGIISNKVSKSDTSGLLKNDGSVDTNTYLTSSAITGMLTSSDIADNLTTNDSTKVLSAKQGKALNDLIGAAITYINQ